MYRLRYLPSKVFCFLNIVSEILNIVSQIQIHYLKY